MSDKKIQGCTEEELSSSVFWANDEESALLTPINIIGYYTRMIESYISTIPDFDGISIKPVINKELEEDFSDPIIVVKRGNLVPSNIGIMNIAQLDGSHIDLDNFSEKQPDVSLLESKVSSELISLSVITEVYGHSVAEVEKIGNVIHRLIMATGYDAMRISFDFIIAVNPPTLTEVGIVEKHSEVYTLQIVWNIEYKDDSILLIRKNTIKYATIMVREKPEERIIYRFDH